MKLGNLAGAAFGIIFLLSSRDCLAQEAELKEKFGLWSVYCLKEADPIYTKCRVTAGVLANDKPDLWAKVSVSISSQSGDLALTVRTPQLRYLRSGISLGFDGRQAVKGIIDHCSLTSCESVIALDESLVNQIGTRDEMSIEYQISDTKSALLIFDLDQIVSALHSMEHGIGMLSGAIAFVDSSHVLKGDKRFEPVRLLLERRTFAQSVTTNKEVEAWKAPYQVCPEVPSTKVVFVNKDLTVTNEEEFREWVRKSSKCNAGAVAWIKATGSLKAETGNSQKSPALDPVRMASWMVYNQVSKSMLTGVVPEEGSGVAVFPAGTISLTASSRLSGGVSEGFSTQGSTGSIVPPN